MTAEWSMRIVFLLDIYPHPFKPYYDVQFEEFRKAGHDVLVVALASLEEGTGRGIPEGIRYRRIWALRERPIRNVFWIIRNVLLHPARVWRAAVLCLRERVGVHLFIRALVIDSQLPEEDPELFFAHSLVTAVHHWFLPAVRPGARYVMYYHGGEVPGTLTVSPEEARRGFDSAHIVFTNTRAAETDVVSRGCDPGKVRVVPVGFRLEDFGPGASTRTEDGDGVIRLVAVGRLAVEKGFHLVVEAMDEIRRRDPARRYHLTIIGDGPDIGRLDGLVRRLRLDDRIEFTGWLDHAEVVSAMRDGDALVHTSVGGNTASETQATVLQEAMLVGLPVVASAIGGVPESIPQALHPYLFSPGDSTTLAENLLALFEGGKERARALGESGRRFVLAHYDVRTTNQKLLDEACRGHIPAGSPGNPRRKA